MSATGFSLDVKPQNEPKKEESLEVSRNYSDMIQYDKKGDQLLKDKNYQDAINNYKNSLALADKMNIHLDYTARLYRKIASGYYNLSQKENYEVNLRISSSFLKLALKYYDSDASRASHLEDDEIIKNIEHGVNAYIDLSKIAITNQEFYKAFNYSLMALELNKKLVSFGYAYSVEKLKRDAAGLANAIYCLIMIDTKKEFTMITDSYPKVLGIYEKLNAELSISSDEIINLQNEFKKRITVIEKIFAPIPKVNKVGRHAFEYFNQDKENIVSSDSNHTIIGILEALNKDTKGQQDSEGEEKPLPTFTTSRHIMFSSIPQIPDASTSKVVDNTENLLEFEKPPMLSAGINKNGR